MDRDKRFDRVKLAYDAIVCQEGESFECPVQYVKDSYAKDVLDEFVIPGYNKNVEGTIDDGDSVIFANFRPCLLYTSPSPRDGLLSRMPSSA